MDGLLLALRDFSEVRQYRDRAIISLISNIDRAAEALVTAFRVKERESKLRCCLRAPQRSTSALLRGVRTGTGSSEPYTRPSLKETHPHPTDDDDDNNNTRALEVLEDVDDMEGCG